MIAGLGRGFHPLTQPSKRLPSPLPSFNRDSPHAYHLRAEWLLQPERRKRHCRLAGKAGKVCHCGRPHHRQSKQYRQYDLPYFEKTGLLPDCREFRCYSIAEPWDDSEDLSASKPARGRSVVAGATRQTGKLPARSYLWPQSCARDPCINIQTARLSQNLRIYPIEQFQLPAYPCPRERSYPTER